MSEISRHGYIVVNLLGGLKCMNDIALVDMQLDRFRISGLL